MKQSPPLLHSSSLATLLGSQVSQKLPVSTAVSVFKYIHVKCISSHFSPEKDITQEQSLQPGLSCINYTFHTLDSCHAVYKHKI